MKIKHDIVLSILISFFFSSFTGFILNYFANLSKIVFTFLVIFIFSFSFFIFNYSFKYLISKSVKNILDQFYSNEYKLKDKNSIENLETLSNSLKKYASEKKLEIELLKEQENYRKDFIGNLAHELKTPLFTIQSYILTLLDGGLKDSEILPHYLKRSSKAVDRLIYLVKDLDLISQFETGIKSIESKPFNLVQIVNNVFELLELESKKNNISLVFDKEYSEEITVVGDEERIQQVITNLVTNSIKYGVKNGTTEISLHELNQEKIIVRITDNGLGIGKKHLPRLFERFYRVDKSGNRKKGGSGLGLSIVKHIIEAHQEKVYVESTKGVGSEFSFTLQKA